MYAMITSLSISFGTILTPRAVLAFSLLSAFYFFESGNLLVLDRAGTSVLSS